LSGKASERRAGACGAAPASSGVGLRALRKVLPNLAKFTMRTTRISPSQIRNEKEKEFVVQMRLRKLERLVGRQVVQTI